MEIFSLDKLSNMFVRPTRQTYKKSDLGPKEFCIGANKRQCYRDDFTIPVAKEAIECSLFSNYPKQQQHKIDRCVLYLHCNTGCRVEGLPYVKPLLNQGYAVVLFDFIGSGVSSGEYISLGYNETYDIQTVISYLRRLNKNVQVALWGRSMGSVAAIRHCSQSTDVKALVLDSPFGSLRELALHIGSQKTWFPEFIIGLFLYMLNPRIKDKVGIELEDIDSHAIINHMRVPALFVTSDKDNVVKSVQVQKLYDEYVGPKEILYIEKDHHELRPIEAINDIIGFLNKTFGKAPTTRDNITSSTTLSPKNTPTEAPLKKTSVRRIHTKQGDWLKGNFKK